MAEKEDKGPAPGTEEFTLKTDYNNDVEGHDEYIRDFDAYEAMLVSKAFDSVSRTVKSSITDGATATIAIERAARVAGQLPSGVVRAAGKKDTGKGLLMDIIRQKWIYPNANAQFSFLIKQRLWQLGSSVYGYMPMYYDWHVSPSGYIGPDCWLWNPRNLIFQEGFTNISDMEHVHGLVYVGKAYLKSLLDEPDAAGWKKETIEEILEELKSQKLTNQSSTERNTQYNRDRHSTGTKGILLATRYESGKGGRWITFLPERGFRIIRNIKNPHNNAKIPFVIKWCMPLWDTAYGLGDFQRHKPIQFAKDGLTNFYFEGIKNDLYRPIVANANGVVKHTLNIRPNGVILETQPNSVRRLDGSTAGLTTYQSAMSQFNGMEQNLAGSTTTQLNAESARNPQFGKTPQALQMQAQRESTRDNQDRFFLEQAMEELLDNMLGLIPEIATENIPIDLFAEDINEIVAAGYDDVLDVVKGKKKPKGDTSYLQMNESEESGRLVIKPKELKGIAYRFNLDQGSTMKIGKQEQKESLLDFLGVIGKFQNELKDLRDTTGKEVDWQHIFTQYGILADVPGFDNVFKDVEGWVPPDQRPPEPAPMAGQPAMPGMPPMQPPMAVPPMPMDAGPLAPPSPTGGYQFADPEIAQQVAALESMRGGGGAI